MTVQSSLTKILTSRIRYKTEKKPIVACKERRERPRKRVEKHLHLLLCVALA